MYVLFSISCIHSKTRFFVVKFGIERTPVYERLLFAIAFVIPAVTTLAMSQLNVFRQFKDSTQAIADDFLERSRSEAGEKDRSVIGLLGGFIYSENNVQTQLELILAHHH
jgi:hypothetical protein